MTQGESNESWRPHLVRGVSIWRLTAELNTPELFAGRLLVPTVAEHDGEELAGWDLEGLVPFRDAQAKWPSQVQLAAADLHVVFDRVARIIVKEGGPLEEFRTALTLPPIGAAEEANYFYAPSSKKLFVRNWGAIPPGDGKTFTHDGWRKIFREVGAASPSAMAMAAAKLDAPIDAPRESSPAASLEPSDQEKEETPAPTTPRKPVKKQTWWSLPLALLSLIVAGLVGVLSFRTFQEGTTTPVRSVARVAVPVATPDAGADASSTTDIADASTHTESDAGALETEDASADADASSDASTDDDDDDDDASSDAGVSDDERTTKVIVSIGPAAGGADPDAPNTKAGPHRRHDQPDALKWRVASGTENVARTEQRPHRFDVWLATGKSFESVRIEWEDATGKWHAH